MRHAERLLLLLLFSIILCVAGFSLESKPVDVPIGANALIENAKALDGTVIRFRGEAIGDVFPRGEYSWVNLSDGTAAIGVWIAGNLVPEGMTLGSWKAKGTVVEIVGTFHRACLEHGGDLDIHAGAVVALSPGSGTERPIGWGRAALAGLLALAAILAGIRYSRLKTSVAEGKKGVTAT